MSATTRKSSTTKPVLRESAERIWLAGLGALAVTEEEGTKLFKNLVKKGEGFERETRSLLEKQIATVRQAPSTAMRRLEGGVEQTMTGMLHRFGIPTRREIHTLTRRVESLAEIHARIKTASLSSPLSSHDSVSHARRETAAADR